MTFTVSADGIEAGQATLEIADDDRAVLTATPSVMVTEGETITIALRLDPHADNVNGPHGIADSDCFFDFPVNAELTIGATPQRRSRRGRR